MRIRAVLIALGAVGAMSFVPLGASQVGAAQSVSPPTVQGPITTGTGPSLTATFFDLASVGYEQSEYFISGTAKSYKSSGPLSKNGKWTLSTASTTPYKTRVVVYRPSDPKRFNGTVVVEWLNVSGGNDDAAAWVAAHNEIIRSGMAWVGVSAQAASINGAAGSVGAAAGVGGLKAEDPARYGSLSIPSDSFSYSIFQQAGAAVRDSAATLFDGLKPKRVIAIGESQSASRLVTYVNALQSQSPGIFNGYLIYSRGAAGAPLSQAPQQSIAAPTPTFIRTDLKTPVLMFETEADLLTLNYLPAQQPPTKLIREWEVAGTAHDDTYGLGIGWSDTGDGVADQKAFQSMLTPPADPIKGIIDCSAPINAGSHTYELRAALAALNSWVQGGKAPSQSPRLAVANGKPLHFVTGASGNALGGIQTPQVAGPVATLSGIGQPASGNSFCTLFGATVPYSAAKLAQLYPTHASFVKKWDAVTAGDVKKGYLLPADAKVLNSVAAQSSVGG